MGSRTFIVAAMLILAVGMLSACAQNPSAEGVDASAARAEAQDNTMPIEEQRSPENPVNQERSTGCIPIELYDVMGDATTIPDGVVCDEPTLVEESKPMPEPTTDTSADPDASSQAIRDVVMGANPPKYQVKKDGTLIIGGDVVVRCADLLKSDSQAASAPPKIEKQIAQASKEQVKVCTKAGFPPDRPSR